MANAGYSPAEILAAESELPPGISPQDVAKAGCDEVSLRNERLAGVSAKMIKQYAGCSAQALKAAGFTNDDLTNAGFSPQEIAAAVQPTDASIRAAGCDPAKLKVLFNQGVSAKRIHDLNGCSAAQLKAAGYGAQALLDAGFTPADLAAAGFSPKEIGDAEDITDSAIRAAGCDSQKLKVLLSKGVSAKRIHDLNGCSAAQLKAAGYDAKALLAAGFTPAELLAAGFTPQQLNQAGINPAAIIAAGRSSDCSVASLTAARAAGVSASTIRETLGCSAAAMKAAGYTAAELKAAGFTAAELKAAGFSAAELKAAGFSAKELKDAGFTAAELKNAGFTAKDLKDAGFSAKDLKDAGFNAKDLKDAGFSAQDLKDAGFSAQEMKDAGFSAKDLKDAGFSAKALLDAGFTPDEVSNAGYTAADLAAAGIQNSQVAALNSLGDNPNSVSTMPSVPGYQGKTNKTASAAEDENAKKLQQIMARQTQQQADQRYQQKIQQRTSEMLSSANLALQGWKKVGTQTYVEGTPEKIKTNLQSQAQDGGADNQLSSISQKNASGIGPVANTNSVIIKTGDILFAVIDTSVNSDEPGPILATIVSGKLKGAKLIGSFNLPSNADKMIITFNTLSIPGASKTTSINAYAIDADTARTALSSDTNHHYMMRYGSLFASSFLEGFGNAFQSANTTVTVGGVGGTGQVTVQNGIGRSALENAVIGLATVGKSWGQVAQQNFNRPTTVQVYSGTGVGILFTQDLTL